MDQMIQEITLLFGSALTICVALNAFARRFDLREAENEISNHCFFYGCHFILHPTLGFCNVDTGWQLRTQSNAKLKSLPVTGLLFDGRESSN